MKQVGVFALVALSVLIAPVTGASAATPVGTPRFRYDVATDAAYAKVRAGDIVVIGPQADDAAEQLAIASVHARGGKAFRYQQWYWQPNGTSFEGLNISKKHGWAFCTSGTTPLVDTVAHGGRKWTYLDMNERNLRNAMVTQLMHLRALGYDGIFVDRGAAALTGALSQKVSTCTVNPVMPARTLADAYVGMLSQAHGVGLRVALNTGPLKLLTPRAVGVSAIMQAAYLLDEGAAKHGVTALQDDARIAAAYRRVAWTLIRPGPDAAALNRVAAQVPAVRVIHGVRAAEDVP